jgi:hypothetical protein
MRKINMDKELNRKMISWLSSGEIGESSITIWTVIMDLENHNPSIPYDVSDFQRCYRLLELCDEGTKEIVLKKLACRYNIWKPYVQNWNKLSKLYVSRNIKEFNSLMHIIIGR